MQHQEQHFLASDIVRDLVIGMSDGLTVPFAIAAGMSGIATGTQIVIVAGLAEIAAGSISMGLGGFLSGQTDVDHYEAERRREFDEVRDVPETEAEEVAGIFRQIGLDEPQIQPVVSALRRDPNKWVDFMMRFELGLERPDRLRALRSALTIGGAYALSGLIPLAPYLIVADVPRALGWSAAVTMAALILFGHIKGRVTGIHPWRSSLQTAVVGGLAAAAAFGLARLIG
jgi:VIT1/CCC1 family predicted Fe2+/Mn2+ transporter